MLKAGSAASSSWLLARLSVQNRLVRQQQLRAAHLAAVGEAVAGLAHESRSALQRSQAGLEILKLRLEDFPKSLDLLTEIQKAQYYLHELYEEVRGYSAPLNLRIESTHLGALLRQTWSSLDVQFDLHAAQLIEVPAEVDLECPVDARAMEQVFRNVLENALSAAEPAEVRVRWSDTRQDGIPSLHVSIVGNGPGLSDEQRHCIFDPFYTTKTRGTGLGMAISKRIVEAHGGQITVGPACDGGTEIEIVLPCE